MLLAILTGLLLTMATVAIHSAGTSWWIAKLRQRGKEDETGASLRTNWLLSTTATLLLSLQLIEVLVWALVYLLIPTIEGIQTLEEAIYFSTVTFTTLGYGDVTLSGNWRMLSAIQGATGLLICGWSTAILLAVVQAIRDRVESD
ncbi:MAG: potassium channel family protein [Planctomycetota bacterium]